MKREVEVIRNFKITDPYFKDMVNSIYKLSSNITSDCINNKEYYDENGGDSAFSLLMHLVKTIIYKGGIMDDIFNYSLLLWRDPEDNEILITVLNIRPNIVHRIFCDEDGKLYIDDGDERE